MTTRIKAIDLEDAHLLKVEFSKRHYGVEIVAKDEMGNKVVLSMEKRLIAGFAKQLLTALNEEGVRAQRIGTRDDSYRLVHEVDGMI